MNTEKMLSIGFIAVLLMNTTAILPVNAQANWIAMNPVYILGTHICETFTVRINISVSNMYGFEYKFRWNNTLLELAGTPNTTITLPWSPNFIAKNSYTTNVVPGINEHWIASSALAPASAFTGAATLVTYSFRVKYQPYFPEPDISSLLDLLETKIADDASPPNPILHTVYDGLYEIKAVQPPSPRIRVIDPTDDDTLFNEDNNIPPEGTFDCNVTIEKLSAGYDLWSWEISLFYNTTQLDILNVTEGPFLKSFQETPSTYFMAKYGNQTYLEGMNQTYDDIGLVLAACIFLSDHTQPSGSGVLCTIKFQCNASLFTLYPNIETSILNLTDTKLADSDVFPPPDTVPHEEYDGTYYVPYKKLGRTIDSFTDPYRKHGLKHYTKYIGIGPHMNADAYQPQDEVTLYALVTYNEDPVQNKLVQFEIHAPNDVPIGEFPLFKNAFTNSSGIATIKFMIPWPSINPERALGKWFAYQSVEIVGEKVEDTEWFEVGWTIWLWDVTVVNAKKCASANATALLKNIAIGPFYDTCYANYTQEPHGFIFHGFVYGGQQPARYWKRACFTVVLYDDLGVPIGKEVIWVDVPTGKWCHPYWCSFAMSIHIPKWAFLGTGTAYVNAYTDTSLYGNPYCPEISAEFPITRQ